MHRPAITGRSDRVPGDPSIVAAVPLLALLALVSGCGTTRLTDTQRTGTEQLLVSNAIDQAVAEVDFHELAGKSVYFDPQYLDGTVDRGYLVSSLRQQLLATGCLLQEDRAKATYVVEVRSGGVGTDRHAVLVGVPQMNVPAFMPGQPSQIPEIPLAKKTDQEGIAKIAIFAYNRVTGKIVWQSGIARAMSTSKDTWVLGAGPFQRGTIRNGTEFAGEQLPLPLPLPLPGFEHESIADPAPPLERPACWPEAPAVSESRRLAALLGTIAPPDGAAAPRAPDANTRPGPAALFLPAKRSWPFDQVERPGTPAPSDAKPAADSKPAAVTAPAPLPPIVPNAGGQAETEPNRVLSSGLTNKLPTTDCETEPRIVVDTPGAYKPDM